MKTVKILIPLLAIFMVMTACQKESILEDQADYLSQDDQIRVLEDQADGATLRKNHPVPFHATFTSTLVTLPPQPNPDICGEGAFLHVDQTLTGNATHLGTINGTISSCFDTENIALFDVKFNFEAANGDSLYIVDFAIVGGTGRFDDATGNVTGSFVPIAPGVFLNELDGEIQY